jgi:hypothetical protein
MSANIQPVFPVAPVIGIATLTSATAITSRANITGTTGLVQLTPTSTNGKRIDAITVKGKGTTVASNVHIWMYNGTTSFLFDEFDVTAITAANTTDSFTLTKLYSNLVLPPTYQLYVSETVQTDVNVFAFGGDY